MKLNFPWFTLLTLGKKGAEIKYFPENEKGAKRVEKTVSTV